MIMNVLQTHCQPSTQWTQFDVMHSLQVCALLDLRLSVWHPFNLFFWMEEHSLQNINPINTTLRHGWPACNLGMAEAGGRDWWIWGGSQGAGSRKWDTNLPWGKKCVAKSHLGSRCVSASRSTSNKADEPRQALKAASSVRWSHYTRPLFWRWEGKVKWCWIPNENTPALGNMSWLLQSEAIWWNTH